MSLQPPPTRTSVTPNSPSLTHVPCPPGSGRFHTVKVAMASQGGSFMNMMSEDTDVDVLCLSQQSPVPSNAAKGGIKRSANYTHKEDIQLCMSWENISNDPVIGNEQPGKAYWKRIAEHFHANRHLSQIGRPIHLSIAGVSFRKSAASFKLAMIRLNVDIQVESHTKSIVEAQDMYAAKEPKNKSFQFLHCWLKVRYCQKFISLETNKRPRPTKARTPTSTPEGGSQEEEKGANDSQKSQTPDSAQPPAKKTRPPGRKQSKEKLKNGEVGDYKEVMQELIVAKERDQMLKEKDQEIKEIDRKMKEDRWKETKMLEERKVAIEERRLVWEQEQKIMFCDVSTLDPDQKAYVYAMRAQLAASRVASLNGGFGGTTGAFGGGTSSFGDGNGADFSSI
ncbi:hypothetical protein ACP70R_000475 [Stipagrostis hirtigluma subsp. patula]